MLPKILIKRKSLTYFMIYSNYKYVNFISSFFVFLLLIFKSEVYKYISNVNA